MIQALSSVNYQLLLLYSLLFDRDFPFFMGIHNKLFCLLFVYSKTLFVKHYIHPVVGAGTVLCMSVCKSMSSILVKFFLFDPYYVWEFLKRMNGLELMKC